MRSTLLFAGLAGSAALLVLTACGDDSSPSGTEPLPDSGGSLPDAQTQADSGATTDEAGDDEATTPPVQVSFRIAHLSPDAPPFDVCLAPTGTSDFQGPFLNDLAAATAAANGTPLPGENDDTGATPGLTYGQVSAYFTIDQGTYDVRLVAAGAASCDVPLGGLPAGIGDAGADAAVVDATIAGSSIDAASADAGGSLDDSGSPADAANSDAAVPLTTLPSVVVGSTFTTLLVAGEVTPSGTDPALVVAPVADDSILVSGGATLRVVNALASGVSQDFGFQSADGGGFLSVFANVGFAQAATQLSPGEGMLDGNGYLTVGEQDGVSFAARAASDADDASGASADTAATQGLQIDLGAITTVLAIGGDAAGRQLAQLLFCIDNQPSGGALSDCAVLP